MTADDLPDFDDRPDHERLELALQECAVILRRVIGLPQRDGSSTPRVQVDPPPLVDAHDGVSCTAHLAACNALECVGFALGVLDPDPDLPGMMTVEQGLAALTAKPAPTAGWLP